MRIVIYNLNYLPEKIGIAKYTAEMAEWLVQNNHEVRVVTAPPYYPAWKIFSGYSGWRYRRETMKGVTLFRCPIWVPQKPNGWKRLLHLLSYALSSIPVMFYQIFWRPDVIFLVEPPLVCAPVAWLIARLSRAKAWLHVQDFEVGAAVELGILPDFIRRLAGAIERCLMRRFDRVSTISDKMMERLLRCGVDPAKTFLFPNWVDANVIFPLKEKSPMREALKLSDSEVVVLYSGNMGKKQGLEIIIEAAQALSGEKNIKFILCGEGPTRESLVAAAKDLKQVQFLPLQPADKLNELLNAADIHLLPQLAEAADLVMPSKLLGILASGRPVVATAKSDTQLAQVVTEANAGLVVLPQDGPAFTQAILTLARDTAIRQSMGHAAREYAVSHLSLESLISHAFSPESLQVLGVKQI